MGRPKYAAMPLNVSPYCTVYVRVICSGGRRVGRGDAGRTGAGSDKGGGAFVSAGEASDLLDDVGVLRRREAEIASDGEELQPITRPATRKISHTLPNFDFSFINTPSFILKLSPPHDHVEGKSPRTPDGPTDLRLFRRYKV